MNEHLNYIFQQIETINPIHSKKLKKNPCWDGYEQAGMKKENGEKVSDCVREKKRKSK